MIFFQKIKEKTIERIKKGYIFASAYKLIKFILNYKYKFIEKIKIKNDSAYRKIQVNKTILTMSILVACGNILRNNNEEFDPGSG